MQAMNQLISIKAHNGQNIVSAKELYQFLKIKRDFTTWCKQMFECGFEIGIDFTPVLRKSTGGRPPSDYALTMDTAKEIAMLQRTEKGKLARRYFIECERQFKEQKNADYKTVQLKARYYDIIIARIALNKEAASIRYQLRKQQKHWTIGYLPHFIQTELFTA
jgi:phage anti-repressor protein